MKALLLGVGIPLMCIANVGSQGSNLNENRILVDLKEIVTANVPQLSHYHKVYFRSIYKWQLFPYLVEETQYA